MMSTLRRLGEITGMHPVAERVHRNRRLASKNILGIGLAVISTAVLFGQAGAGIKGVVAGPKGGIYFTDPGPRPIVPGRKAYVYYLPPGASQPRILDDSITRPNGLTVTNDNKTLIVDDTVGDTVFAFDAATDGSIRNKR